MQHGRPRLWVRLASRLLSPGSGHLFSSSQTPVAVFTTLG